MTPEEIAALARQTMQDALKAEDDRRAAEAAAARQRQEEIDGAVQSALKTQAAAFAKSRRLPVVGGSPDAPGQAPAVTAFADVRKYDSLDVEDMACLCGILDAAARDQRGPRVPETALKALAMRVAEDKSDLGDQARRDLKAAGLDPAEVLNAAKANELDYTTQTGYGDEWVGVEYSRRLWPRIRAGSAVVAKVPTVEVPQGAESIVLPLEGADPTWYNVAQATGNNATTGLPDATVTASKLATARQNATVGKIGARVVYTAEMEEDSLIPWVATLRTQLETSGAENLEAVVIDGDTTLTATTNINDIGGTPAGNENFTVFDGFRKLALVTNTANSRSAGGALADTDFIATVKLMGTVGLNAWDKTKTSFILDGNLHWHILSLAAVKTRDVFLNATLENGVLSAIWGYGVMPSAFMHSWSAVRMVNTAGKVDQDTAGNNTRSAILAVRWDQWLLGYKRRMTFKVQDIPGSDASQIVVTARVGMIYRDTEASAISYNVANA